MADFLRNPRRGARARARCRAAVVSPAGWFETETEDIGAMGCQIVSPKLVREGELLQLVVRSRAVREALLVNGRVAWVSAEAPWRVGVAFDERSLRESTRWYERLVAATPGMGTPQRVPERIRVDAVVYLGAPPRFVLDFTADEAALLRAIGSGARVDELMARLRDRGPGAQRALFSLIARQAITFQRGQSGHPESWKGILSEIEASLAVEALGAPPRPGFAEGGANPTPAPSVAAASGGGPLPGEVLAASPDVRAAAVTGEPGHAPHAPARPSAGSAWRGAPVTRSGEAQATLDRALAEIRTGSTHAAIALLREALSLAPGDPEIADLLGKLAFKGRAPPG